jgi:hypothetical protein
MYITLVRDIQGGIRSGGLRCDPSHSGERAKRGAALNNPALFEGTRISMPNSGQANICEAQYQSTRSAAGQRGRSRSLGEGCCLERRRAKSPPKGRLKGPANWPALYSVWDVLDLRGCSLKQYRR